MDGMKKMAIYLKIDWLVNLKNSDEWGGINFYMLMTKSAFEKVISNKITNPEDLLKYIIKTSIKYKYPWKLVREFIINESVRYNMSNFGSRQTSINLLISISKHTTSPNHALLIINQLTEKHKQLEDILGYTYFGYGKGEKEIEREEEKEAKVPDNIYDGFILKNILTGDTHRSNMMIIREHLTLINDVLLQCVFLDIKMNLTWSNSRLHAEHEKLTNILMQFDIDSKDSTKIDFDRDIASILLPNMQLIDCESECFREGTVMHHCIYTNYWSRICNREYFAVRLTLPERCTVGIRYVQNKDCIVVDQIQGKHNSRVTAETTEMVNNWLASNKVQDFFKENCKIRQQIFQQALAC